jgi:dUTPase
MATGFGEEPLSLGTFDPAHAQAPYLNTPRSLEACRRFGVNPIELVEVSIDEFRKDAPDDPDAAQRRFERVDGARRRLMTNVMTEWKVLMDTDWHAGPKKRPRSAKEAIMKVRPEVHSQLLELQAEKFRKMEQAHFDEMQRMLAITIQKADMEVKNKATLAKHEEAKVAGNNHAKLMQEKRAALLQKQLEERNEKDRLEAIRIKELQVEDARLAREKIAKTEKRLKKEKEGREARERERLQREEYTKELKSNIMKSMNTKADQKKKLSDLKNAESNARKLEAEEEKKRREAKRRKEDEKRAHKAREDAIAKADGERQKMLDAINADEMKRTRLKEHMEFERLSKLAEKHAHGGSKAETIAKAKNDAIEVKKNKTLQELRFKDSLTKQELAKVEAGRQKRQQAKAIRQEAYDLAAMRQAKADEYKVQKAKEEIRIKNEKCKAIQDGFKNLSYMRNKMKDIMERTKIELEHEIHVLNHKGIISPDKVMQKAMEVTQTNLFPKLKGTFGLVDPVDAADEARINSTVGDDDMRAKTAPSSSFDTNMEETGGGGGGGHKNHPMLLPIHYMNKSRLEGTLNHARNKIDIANDEEEARKDARQASPPRNRTSSPKNTRRGAPGKGSPGSPGKKSTRFEDGDKALTEFPYGVEDEGTPGKGKGRKGKQGVVSHKTTFQDTGEGQYRKEYSSDHPLAPGGTGKYKTEENKGLAKMGVKKMSTTEPKGTMSSTQASHTIEKLSLQSQNPVVDPEKHLEQLRREQNEALMRVLQEEKGNEESRERMAHSVLSEQEAERMELVFAEERRRASERIVRLTKEHEQRVKEAVLSMMNLKKHRSHK